MALDYTKLRESFNLVKDKAEQIIDNFYETLFNENPGVISLFGKADMKEQKKKLLASVALVIELADKPETLVPALAELGERHKSYGALPEHYPIVAKTLIASLKKEAGEAWNDGYELAWSNALTTAAQVMTK